MQAICEVPLMTPDGVQRAIRCTPGALKRIETRFGTADFMRAVRERGDWVVFEVAYLMMYDRDGKPPSDLTMEGFLEVVAYDDVAEVLGAICSAVEQGRKKKEDLEQMFRTMHAKAKEEAMRIGAKPPRSRSSISRSSGESSGTDIQ